MRDIAILLVIMTGAVAALRYAWVGVLMWTWVSVMNPHSLGWGFVQSMPVAMIVALATMLGLVFSKEKRNPFSEPAVILLALFMTWITVTWPLSYYPQDSFEMLTRVLKIDVMLLVTVALLVKREYILWFLGVVVFSIGFYGVKGGVFTLSTGGTYRVWGPGGFISGNNELALAIILVIPLMYFFYLLLPSEKRLQRGLVLLAMALSAAAALGSHSRGALVAIAAMVVFLWWRTGRSLGFGVLMVLAGSALLAFMPSNWSERMGTIETYESDSSAMGRINAWKMAFNLANDNLGLGGGFSIYEAPLFARYAPNPEDIHAAHSIYFQVLGEHGWIGLIIWLAIWIYAWRTAGWLRRNGSEADGTTWCVHLGAMSQVSLLGFAVGGAFLSLAYFDLPYNVLVAVVATKRWLLEHGRSPASARVSMRGTSSQEGIPRAPYKPS